MVGVRRDRGAEASPPRAASWGAADLRRPGTALIIIVSGVGAAVLAFILSCNLHEIAHAAVGTAFGWEVDRISFCFLSDGAVHYRRSSARGDIVESWSGGLVGAFSLVVVYAALVARRSGPLRSPALWAAGLGLSVPMVPQLIIAGLEGTNRTTAYSETIAEAPILWNGILFTAAATGPIVHMWAWRQVKRADQKEVAS